MPGCSITCEGLKVHAKARTHLCLCVWLLPAAVVVGVMAIGGTRPAVVQAAAVPAVAHAPPVVVQQPAPKQAPSKTAASKSTSSKSSGGATAASPVAAQTLHADPAAQDLTDRLYQYIKELGGNLEAGWSVEIKTRASGSTQGHADTYYRLVCVLIALLLHAPVRGVPAFPITCACGCVGSGCHGWHETVKLQSLHIPCVSLCSPCAGVPTASGSAPGRRLQSTWGSPPPPWCQQWGSHQLQPFQQLCRQLWPPQAHHSCRAQSTQACLLLPQQHLHQPSLLGAVAKASLQVHLPRMASSPHHGLLWLHGRP